MKCFDFASAEGESGLAFTVERQHATGQLVALRGNHEIMMLNAREDDFLTSNEFSPQQIYPNES